MLNIDASTDRKLSAINSSLDKMIYLVNEILSHVNPSDSSEAQSFCQKIALIHDDLNNALTNLQDCRQNVKRKY